MTSHMATARKRQGSRGCRKIGRAKDKCQRYRQEHRREKNKIRKLSTYCRHHPNDKQTARVLERYKNQIFN